MVPYSPAGPPVYPRSQIHPRGRAGGAIVSIFVPGVGSMINGSVGRGLIILGSYIVACVLCLVLIGFIIAPAVWIWGIIDGALSADRWNRKHGIIS
jgi:TM2 domain-containing membrane protein YozV